MIEHVNIIFVLYIIIDLNMVSKESIYQLFINKQFKKLYDKIKNNPKILNLDINDNKTILHYLIQTNNIETLNQILDLDKKNILTSNDKKPLPSIALKYSLYDLFFDLVDKYIKTDSSGELFNKMIGKKYLLVYVIQKNDYSLFDKFFSKYHTMIDFTLYYYIHLIIDSFHEHIEDLLKKFKVIVDQTDKKNLEKLFKYPLSDNPLFFLLYLKYSPQIIIKPNGKKYSEKETKHIKSEHIKEFIELYPQQVSYNNQIYYTPIFYPTLANDINMIKFMIDYKTDLNYVSPLGYVNYPYYLLSKSNLETIKYVSKYEISYNHLNNYNETPIYAFIRNPYVLEYQKPDNKLNIEPLLEIYKIILDKTIVWDSQNVFGQTFIHLIVNKPYLEQLYDILKTKYFNLNIKNRFKQSPLDIYVSSLTLQKLSNDDIKKKINNLRSLVMNTYLNKLEALSDSISNSNSNTNSDSDNQNQLDVNVSKVLVDCKKKDKTCWDSVSNLLTKPIYSDLDNLSNDYRKINIIDYQSVDYNLFYARDSDWFLYFVITTIKYDIVGVPLNDNSFDKKRILEINYVDQKKDNFIEDFDQMEYINVMMEYTSKYYMLYPITIYWINSSNIIIPYNLIDSIMRSVDLGKKIIIIRIKVITKESLHANILIVDIFNKRIIRFEPQGGVIKNTDLLDYQIASLFKNSEFFSKYKYYRPSDYMPINGFQSISHETNKFKTKRGDINGFCVAWCIWFIELYIQNLNSNMMSDKEFKSFVSKVIKKLINGNYWISDYIRNYGNYIHKKLIEYLVNNGFKYSNLFFERSTDEEINNIFNHIHSFFLKIN